MNSNMTNHRPNSYGFGLPSLIASVVILVIVLIAAWCAFDIVKIEGHQTGVMETWTGGVYSNTYAPRTYVCFPGEHLKPYDVQRQTLSIDNYTVPSLDQQPMHINATIQWQLRPETLVAFHKNVHGKVDETLLIPMMHRIIKDCATSKKAIDAYAGEGLVKLQAEINKAAQVNEELASYCRVDNFVITRLDLEPEFLSEIKGRQVATQKQLRAVEEEKAANAQALVAKALAQADLNKQVVEAERDKQVAVLKAEAQKQKTVLDAEASKQQQVLAAQAESEKLSLTAEGQLQSDLKKAKGIQALGSAEAEATKLKLSAYSVPGADAFVKVEVAKQLGTAYSGIKGYIPERMGLNVMSENFDKGVSLLLNPTPAAK